MDKRNFLLLDATGLGFKTVTGCISLYVDWYTNNTCTNYAKQSTPTSIGSKKEILEDVNLKQFKT